MKISVIFSNPKNIFAFNIISSLIQSNIKIHSVIFIKKSKFKENIKILKNFKKSGIKIFRNLIDYNFTLPIKTSLNKWKFIKSISKNNNNELEGNCFIEDLCKKNKISFFSFKELNSNDVKNYLIQNKVSILCEAGTGIYRKILIDIPDLTILNVHIGKLPNYKGMNVMEWAILQNDDIWASIHKIDVGIDTGPICYMQKMAIENIKSIKELRKQGMQFCAKTLADYLSNKNHIDIRISIEQSLNGRQYFVMHENLKKIVENKLPVMPDFT
ncbi:hypothetical protein KAZ01_01720 [Candidatus Gracilibacteria bacterium]|nr:hypothetical protein [Candidatus Gracilibacteria bacterium]